MKQRIVVCLLLVAVLACFALGLTGCISDKTRTQYLFDDKGLFDSTQKDTINTACAEATERYNVPIYVATCDRTSSGKAVKWGEDVMNEKGLEGDTIIIIINATGLNDNYHFDVYTYGYAATRVKDGEVEEILYSSAGDDILKSNSAIATNALVDMVDLCGQAYKGRLAGSYLGYIVVMLILITVITVAITLYVKKQYSRQRKNDIYPLDKYCTLNLKDHSDDFVNSVTTYVVIQTSSGGGGHSSGGGGGGGHRGGR